ncbi:hypothetical protein CN608_25895 [Bacillus pseudomycoides]|nr:hypothetical protein CN608_25895 [Bacillus pseudomycoides]
MNKTQYSVNTVDTIIFLQSPIGAEQLVFANCSFIFINLSLFDRVSIYYGYKTCLLICPHIERWHFYYIQNSVFVDFFHL